MHKFSAAAPIRETVLVSPGPPCFRVTDRVVRGESVALCKFRELSGDRCVRRAVSCAVLCRAFVMLWCRADVMIWCAHANSVTSSRCIRSGVVCRAVCWSAVCRVPCADTLPLPLPIRGAERRAKRV
jgi:hypothetical protein